MASAIIYQNVVDPRVHALSASETSREMWLKLVTKFHHKSKVLKGQAMDVLQSLKLVSRRDLPALLDALTKLCSDALDALDPVDTLQSSRQLVWCILQAHLITLIIPWKAVNTVILYTGH
jgi:hypothetical protein